VWQVQAGHLCWFLSGVSCEGKVYESWEEKMQLCRRCEVFQASILSSAGQALKTNNPALETERPE
jgi:hypothetical protein